MGEVIAYGVNYDNRIVSRASVIVFTLALFLVASLGLNIYLLDQDKPREAEVVVQPAVLKSGSGIVKIVHKGKVTCGQLYLQGSKSTIDASKETRLALLPSPTCDASEKPDVVIRLK